MRTFAFLRAINVGRRTVRMERLREEFTALGFSGVETFIASGNVIFESGAVKEKPLRERIERHLHGNLGFEVTTFLRSSSELTNIVNRCPFSTAPGASVYVAFLAVAPETRAAKDLMACQSQTDQFHVHNREIYWLCRTTMSDSKFSGALLEKILRQPATIRNLTTLQKLTAKYPPLPGT